MVKLRMPGAARGFLGAFGSDHPPSDPGDVLRYEAAMADLDGILGSPDSGIRRLNRMLSRMPDIGGTMEATAVWKIAWFNIMSRDLETAMRKYMKAMQILEKDLDDREHLELYCDIAADFALAADTSGWRKRGGGALRKAVREAEARRDRFPTVYAWILVERAKFLWAAGAVDPRYGEYMRTAIDILEHSDEGGTDTYLLILAHFYNSYISGREDPLDPEEMGRAYALLTDALAKGDIPDGPAQAVFEAYVSYLDVFDRGRSAEVRAELHGMGFDFPPPPDIEGGRHGGIRPMGGRRRSGRAGMGRGHEEVLRYPEARLRRRRTAVHDTRARRFGTCGGRRCARQCRLCRMGQHRHRHDHGRRPHPLRGSGGRP